MTSRSKGQYRVSVRGESVFERRIVAILASLAASLMVAGMLIGPIMLLVVAPALQVMFLGTGGPAPAADASDAATRDASHPHT